MMGVYGMLALGLAMFCLRYLIPADRWPEKWARICFWSTNIGLAWMCFATLLPLGILQLYKSVDERLLRGARAGVPDQRHQRADRVAAAARATSSSSSAARSRRSTSPTSASATPSSGSPSTSPTTSSSPSSPSRAASRPAADEATAARLTERRRSSSPPAMPRCSDRSARSCSSGCPRTRTGARCATAPRASPTTTTTITGLPRGRAPVAARVRPRAPAGALPRQGARLQRAARARTACTDSDRGREIVRPLDPWPHSEAGPLPPRHLADDGRARAAHRPRRGRTPPRAGRSWRCSGAAGRRPPRRPAGCATCAPTRRTSRSPTPSQGSAFAPVP